MSKEKRNDETETQNSVVSSALLGSSALISLSAASMCVGNKHRFGEIRAAKNVSLSVWRVFDSVGQPVIANMNIQFCSVSDPLLPMLEVILCRIRDHLVSLRVPTLQF